MRDNQAGIQAVFGVHNRVFGCAFRGRRFESRKFGSNDSHGTPTIIVKGFTGDKIRVTIYSRSVSYVEVTRVVNW